MQEAGQSVLPVANYSYETVLAFLEYIYGEELEADKFSVDFLFELLQLSDEYLLDDLYKLCHKKIKAKVNVANVCDILVAADGLNLAEIKAQCLELTIANFAEVTQKESYNRMIKYPHLLLEITREMANHMY